MTYIIRSYSYSCKYSEEIRVVGIDLDPESSFLSGANSAHPKFPESCYKSSVEKMLRFFRCSRVVSDMAEVRFDVNLSRSRYQFYSILAVFFSLFSDRGKNWSGACADIIKRTCHSQADLYGSSETQTYNFQTQTYLQLTNAWLLHHAIHVGVAAFPGGSRLQHRFYKQS